MYNRTSPITSGFYYQYLWGMKLCSEWLQKPTDYQWIQFETYPDDEDSNQFYLDDIVCLRLDGEYQFYQIKYKQNLDDLWTWDDLLVAKKSSGTSNIRKWTQSLLSRLAKTEKAVFVTNGLASDEIKQFLQGDIIDIDEIKKKDQILFDQIKNEVGTEEDTIAFFEKMQFSFSNKGIDDLEDETRTALNRSLYVTKSGVDNLLLEIHRECRKRQTTPLHIDTLRQWCEFDNPRPLYEDFEIPQDFEFFDNKKHRDIVSDLQGMEGGIKVIFGKPGVGKSVYLSKLYAELKETDIISVKHHYHISPADSNHQERLNSERVIEAIKAQFKLHHEELGELANKNSQEIPLCEFFSSVASNQQKKEKPFVFILDGLDHVLRYGEKEDLETFLQEICLPQPGVWIVLGMQPIAKSHLPQIVFDTSSEEQWIEIKGLGRSAVSRLMEANDISLHLPDDIEQLHTLVEKLYSITQGNPLHLRYSLQQLKVNSGDSLVTEYDCADLILYSGDIEKYYHALWAQIPDDAQTFLLAISSVSFLFTERQLTECVSSFVTNPADITRNFNAISHVVSRNVRNQISVYHNSFELFLNKRPELEQQDILLKTNIKTWLEKSSHEYLKWAELRMLECDLGNAEPLLSIDRQWLIDAICYPSNTSQIEKQMKMASRVAYDCGDLTKALKISQLHTHYSNTMQFSDEVTEFIWQESIQQNKTALESIDIRKLPVPVLPTLAKIADSNGNFPVVEEILDILVDGSAWQELRQGTIPDVTSALLKVLPYNRQHDTEGVYKYILQFRDLEITESLFEIYTCGLLALGQNERVQTLLGFDLTTEELERVLDRCMVYTLNGYDDAFELHAQESTSLFFQLGNGIKGNCPTDLPALPAYDVFPESVEEYDSNARTYWSGFYYDQFILGILYGLVGKDDDIAEWLKDIPDLWAARATSCLLNAGLNIATGIQNSQINFDDLFDPFVDLNELEWPNDRDALSLQRALKITFEDIVRDIFLIKNYLSDDREVSLEDHDLIAKKPEFYSSYDLLELNLSVGRRFLSKELYEKMLNDNTSRLSQTVGYFPDRARTYVELAKFARVYGELDTARTLLVKSADNVMGYGYHKDMCLFHVLECIDFCVQYGVSDEKVNNWIQRVAPLTEYVGDYTDGDETNGLPFELAGILGRQNPILLYKNYYEYADKEDFYHAEDLFKHVIEALPFDSEEQVALGTTALDKDSLSMLKESAQDKGGAKKALDILRNYLGEIEYQEDKYSSTSESNTTEPDYSLVEPEGIVGHLETEFENRWERDNYLVGWSTFWVNNESNKKKIYAILKTIAEDFNIGSYYGAFYDILYPLAYEFDNEIPFEYLCQAQRNDSGWSKYLTDEKKATKRWMFLKEKYPERYLEFLDKSTGGYVPIPRGVEFLLLFGELEKSETITEASVQFAESLMADMVFPTVNWTVNKGQAIDEIDILFQRLLWPSSIVKERATTAIAHLLVDSDNRMQIYRRLLDWIAKQKMESAVAICLLPLIKAFYVNTGGNDLRYIDLDSVINALSMNTIVIEKLVEELAMLCGKKLSDLPAYSDVESPPPNYVKNEFFIKYGKTYLAPIYFMRAEIIEERTPESFIKQWSFTFEKIVSECGLSLNMNQIYYYARSERDEALVGFSSKVSEAYRSAFLRVLKDFYEKDLISEDYYLEYAYATMPIELSRWKMAPRRVPAWWPKLKDDGISDEGESPIDTISFVNPIEDVIMDVEGELPIALEGAIQSANGWQGSNPLHSFVLVGFLYRVVGSVLPDAKDVGEDILNLPKICVHPTDAKKPFHFLEDSASHNIIGEPAIRIDDLIIYPIVVREKDLALGIWQYFRDYNLPFNLAVHQSSLSRFEISENGWTNIEGDGGVIGRYFDWLEGLKERYNFDKPLPHGQCLTISRNFIDQLLKDHGLRLGYILKTTYRIKEYSHSDVEVIEDFKLLNVTSLITAKI